MKAEEAPRGRQLSIVRRLLAPEGRSTGLWLSWVAVAAIAIADDVTGRELSLAACYLYPVILSSWHGGRRWGLAVSLCSTALVVLVTAHVGNPFTSMSFFYLYVGAIFVSFITVTEAVVQLRLELPARK